MYIWYVDDKNIEDGGICISLYEASTRKFIQVSFMANFPAIDVDVQASYLRDDFMLDANFYEDLPEIFKGAARLAFDNKLF